MLGFSASFPFFDPKGIDKIDLKGTSLKRPVLLSVFINIGQQVPTNPVYAKKRPANKTDPYKFDYQFKFYMFEFQLHVTEVANLWKKKTRYRQLHNHNLQTKKMQETKGLLQQIKLHSKIGIRVTSNSSNNLPAEVMKLLTKPHRKANYFFIYLEKGSRTHKVDLKELTVTDGQILFILPNQIHTAPKNADDDIKSFKVSFDHDCLALLPRQFSFLINPLNTQIISFDEN